MEVIIILGCRVRGSTPSRTLVMRLERALAYGKGREALYLVSGGLHPKESISEAAVMADFLTQRGIPAHRVLLDPSARSTYANLASASAILDVRLGPGRWAGVYVTSGYHIPRCRWILRSLQLPLRPVAAPSPAWSLPYDILREGCALIKYLLFGYRPLPLFGRRQ